MAEPGSLTEFIVEHYCAYVRARDGSTSEYRVAHRPWRVAPAHNVVWDCDLMSTYGDTPLAEYLAVPPILAFVADGSPVQVFPGRRCAGEPPAIVVSTGVQHGTRDTCPTSPPAVLSPPR